MEDFDKKNTRCKRFSDYTIVLNTKISEAENKILDTNSLVTTTIPNTKISEVENKVPDHAKYITT